ncbi:MAG: HEAT repeat domain-containing protein [Candidatus Heimdallarchaeota archaeon]|nr:MAG: HEAT repeat domain-containing protein [Candidatus Heimdallarchaeota archaeon]
MSEEPLKDLKSLKSKDKDLQWTAINNLRKYLQTNPNPTDFRFRMIVKSILPFTKAAEDNIRENALVTILEAIPDDKNAESLVSSALADPSPGIRSLALEWLSNRSHPQLRTQVIKFLGDPAEIVRKTAMDLVVTHQIEGVETKLLQLLESESGGLRRSIIYALGKLKTPRAIGTLVEIMRNPNYDDWTRNQAGSALEHLGGRELIIPFIENLADPNEYVRETAAAFLSKNEQEIISTVMSKGKIDLIALLQHGSDTTKQNFDSLVSTLSTQMAFAIKDLQSRLMTKDKVVLSELADELTSNFIAVKILIEKILDLRLIPLTDDIYLTETGLKRELKSKFVEISSIHVPTLKEVDPFSQISTEMLEQIISTMSGISQVSSGLYLKDEIYSKIKSEFEETGVLKPPIIAEEINISEELVKNELIPILNPSKDGWYNSHNEYFTLKFLQDQLNEQIREFSIISLRNFLSQIGNPKIELSRLKDIINEHYQGVWLEDIDVFLEHVEFQKLREDSTRIDESRVQHLLNHIALDFPSFLKNLQKKLEIQTYQASDGQLVTLENLHPHLQQRILSKGYISIPEFLREIKLDKMATTVRPIILDYITQEFSGSTTPDTDFFFTEDLIADVTKEVEAKARINFNVLAFKMDLATEVLALIINQILFIRGFINTIGEFVTEEGINQEIKGILEYREEFTLQELFEILEIVKDKKNELIVRDLISDDSNLLISFDDEVVVTQKKALTKVIDYVKSPVQQTKEIVSWEEISRNTNVSNIDVKTILESLIHNNLLSGTLVDKGYRL